MRLVFPRIKKMTRWLAALPPNREDWLLIEPKKGLVIPVPDFQRASHGLSYVRTGLPTANEERRMNGPRLMILLVVYPMILLPVAYLAAAYSYSGRWLSFGFLQELHGLFVLEDGRWNPALVMFFWYPAFAVGWLARLIWVRRRVRQAHFRMPRRDGAPLALPHITPALEQEYLSLSSRAYVIDSTDGRHIRYRQGSRMIKFSARALAGDETKMEVCIPWGSSLVWFEPFGEPVEPKQRPQILQRVQNAIKFAGYAPILTTEAVESDQAMGAGRQTSEPRCG